MKVLFIVSWYYEKNSDEKTTGIFHYELAQEMKKYVDVAIYFPFDNSLSDDWCKSEEGEIITYRSKWNYPNKAAKLLKVFLSVKNIIEDFCPDIIHANTNECAGFLSRYIKIIYKIPLIITEHAPVQMMDLNKKNKYYKAYASADYCTAVSLDLKDKLENIFSPIKFKLIYNGVYDPEKIKDTNIVYMGKNNVNCCVVGAFYNKEVKGYQYLLPALKRCIDDGHPVKLHICGGGEYLPYYKKLSAELGIEEFCIFYGNCHKEKVYAIISQSDFCVSASLFESAGVFVEETMMLGKPMVVTRSGGASSIVNEKNALIVDAGSIEALKKGIEYMRVHYSDYDTREIREDNLKRFAMENICEEYIVLYNGVRRQ